MTFFVVLVGEIKFPSSASSTLLHDVIVAVACFIVLSPQASHNLFANLETVYFASDKRRRIEQNYTQSA
jgi:preprotein translocase subunit SecF